MLAAPYRSNSWARVWCSILRENARQLITQALIRNVLSSFVPANDGDLSKRSELVLITDRERERIRIAGLLVPLSVCESHAVQVELVGLVHQFDDSLIARRRIELQSQLGFRCG